MLQVRRVALVLWFISLVVPTAELATGSVLLGFQVATTALFGSLLFFPFSLAYPLHIASFASNLLVVHGGLQQFKNSRSQRSFAIAIALVIAVALNLLIGPTINDPKSVAPLAGIYRLPGYYVWVSSFALLCSCAWWEHRHTLGAMVKRVAALLIVAAFVVWLCIHTIRALAYVA